MIEHMYDRLKQVGWFLPLRLASYVIVMAVVAFWFIGGFTFGLVIAFGMFLVIFLLPTHLFQNPLRFRKNWPPR